MKYRIQSACPAYDATDRDAVTRVLDNQYTAEGTEAEQFLDAISRYVGPRTGVTTSSGTAALHLLLDAMDIGEGDEVVLPSYTCQSLLHPILHVGATPRLADVSPETFSLTRETVEPELNDRTALIILVHTFGYPVQSPELFDLGVPVLEDVAQAIGSRLPDGTHVGQRGIAALGSLYATKQLSAGYGGFLLTDDTGLAKTLKDRKTYDERETFSPAYNVSLSDLNAALARNQLDKHEDKLSRQRDLAEQYDSQLEPLDPVTVPDRPPGHSLYRYVVSVPDPDPLIDHMTAAGIEVKRPVFEPLHRSLDTEAQPVSESLHDSVVLLPLHSGLTNKDIRTVIDEVRKYFE